jgi:hypothetical protein
MWAEVTASGANKVTTNNDPTERQMTTVGEAIADEFDRDKVSLTPAEKRRLAGMIDARLERMSRMLANIIYQASDYTVSDTPFAKAIKSAAESALAAPRQEQAK